MPEGQVLEFSGVTKRFGAVTAVDGFTARVEPGRVTGFLGPNGAGKTTTLRILLGLVRATGGTATIGGQPYARLAHPLQTVGAVLEASSFHPGRTAANHLRVYAQAAGLPASSVDQALGLVGLADVAGRKIGGYSLGMRQRLGLAYALVGDPGVLVLDEPANGLDPEGIKWMRGLLRDLARQGRTVFVSSHLLAEVQQTVDSLLILSAGRLVFQGALDELSDPSEYATVVDSADRHALAAALHAHAAEVEVLRSGLTVRGLDPGAVGRIAADAGVALTLLQRRGPALEEIFLDLVNGARVHPSAAGHIEWGADAPAAVAAGAAAGAAIADGREGEQPVVDGVADEPVEAAGGEPTEAGQAEAVPAEQTETVPAEVGAAEPTAELTEDDEPSAAAAGAAAGAALAAGAVAAGTDDESTTEEDGEDVAQAAVGTVDAEPPAGAAFAVASTGIIDIVPSAAAEDAPVVAPWASEPEVSEPEDDSAADDSAQPADGSSAPDEEAPAPAADAEPAAGEEPRAEEEPGAEGEAEAPSEGDRPWEDYVKTDADREADRFFAAFDDSLTDRSEPADGAASPVGVEIETPEPDDLGAPPPDWHAQPEPLAADDAGAHAESTAEASIDSPAEAVAEAGPETGPFGTIGDLSADWADQLSESDDAEGGEPR